MYRNRDRRNTTVRACPGTLEAEGHKELSRSREKKGWRLVMRRGDL